MYFIFEFQYYLFIKIDVLQRRSEHKYTMILDSESQKIICKDFTDGNNYYHKKT